MHVSGGCVVDPNAALENAREAIRRIQTEKDTDAYVADLVDAFEALDGWLSRGGFLPEEWKR